MSTNYGRRNPYFQHSSNSYRFPQNDRQNWQQQGNQQFSEAMDTQEQRSYHQKRPHDNYYPPASPYNHQHKRNTNYYNESKQYDRRRGFNERDVQQTRNYKRARDGNYSRNGFPGQRNFSNTGVSKTTFAEQSHSSTFVDKNAQLECIANNIINLNGVSYNVMHIGETALIDKEGYGHQVFLHGTPCNVFINGEYSKLPFGQVVKMRFGSQLCDVEFGTPGKELYVAKMPHRGFFNGSPFPVLVNNNTFEVKICGSCPAVQVSPNPVVWITNFLKNRNGWSKYAEYNRENQLAAVCSTSSNPSVMPHRNEMNDALSNLQLSANTLDILRKLNKFHMEEESSNSASLSAPNLNSCDSTTRQANNNGDLSSKFGLMSFDPMALRRRNGSVVSKLLEKRAISCSYCGILVKTASKDTDEYLTHVKTHYKESFSKKADPPKQQKWYPTSDAWNTPKAAEQAVTNAHYESQKVVVATDGVKACSQTTCEVCNQQFEKYYNAKDKCWRFKDTVRIWFKVYHSECSKNEESIMSQETYFPEYCFSDDESKNQPPPPSAAPIKHSKRAQRVARALRRAAAAKEEAAEQDILKRTFASSQFYGLGRNGRNM